MGTVKLRFEERSEFGVLDHDVILESGVTVHTPIGVVPNGQGSEVMSVLFRQPDMSDGKFAEEANWVRKDRAFSKTCWKEERAMRSDELRIAPAEAKSKVEAGQAIILDVVAPHVWPQMHRAIASAVRIAPPEIEERYHELPRQADHLLHLTR